MTVLLNIVFGTAKSSGTVFEGRKKRPIGCNSCHWLWTFARGAARTKNIKLLSLMQVNWFLRGCR